MEPKDKIDGLQLLRKPFDANHISKLPKPTKAQTDEVKQNFKAGVRCDICGGWHHPKVVHLDYVGHAALTDRLLAADSAWSWDPLAVDANGLPALDKDGGLWIKLTVCGVTRLGYGDAQGKTGGDAMKERIGDALRNAGMRFGAALDLWHKGILHMDDDEPAAAQKPSVSAPAKPVADITLWLAKMDEATSGPELKKIAMDAWDATGDDRIVEHQQKLVAARKAAAKTSLGEQA